MFPPILGKSKEFHQSIRIDIKSISMSLRVVKMTANATAASEDGLLNDNEEGR